MTKKRLFCILGIVLFITIVVGCIVWFFWPSSSPNDEMSSYPGLSYSYNEKINELKTCELDIDVRIEATTLSGGLYPHSRYNATMNFVLNSGKPDVKISQKDFEQILVDVESNVEAYDVLFSTGEEKNYLENNWVYEMDSVIELDKYKIAYIHNKKTEYHDSTDYGERYYYHVDKGHTGIFFIYEISSKRIVYLAELTLNENYCFSHLTGYFNINNINISQ